ncbi:MAG: phosphate starvation-inducible PhoH-like protein [Roseivirga sp.]
MVTGDISQIDLPRNQQSGLGEALRILKGVKGIARVDLDANDVVRHKLVKEIILAYDKHQENNDTGQKNREPRRA